MNVTLSIYDEKEKFLREKKEKIEKRYEKSSKDRKINEMMLELIDIYIERIENQREKNLQEKRLIKKGKK